MGVFTPLELLADELVQLLGLQPGSSLAASIHFIAYDTLKIFILLTVMILLVSYLRTYVNPDTVKRKLGGKRGVGYHLAASGVGVISPFCSCSSIPLFIGFVKAGVPLGMTFSFLITSPLVNEAAIAVLWATFGFKAMALYVTSGLLIGTIGGMIIKRLNPERHVADFVKQARTTQQAPATYDNQKERLAYARKETQNVINKVWPYIIIGVSLGGLIHGYLPEGWISSHLGNGNLLAVPLATIIGVPLYTNVLGAIPVAESLIGKGLQTGTALAFLMAVTALSLPEMIMLKKVLKPRLLAAFIAIVTAAIILTGYLFNIIL